MLCENLGLRSRECGGEVNCRMQKISQPITCHRISWFSSPGREMEVPCLTENVLCVPVFSHGAFSPMAILSIVNRPGLF